MKIKDKGGYLFVKAGSIKFTCSPSIQWVQVIGYHC